MERKHGTAHQAKSLLFVEEEEVPMLPLHHPAHEQTPLCPTLEQKIVCVHVCVCVFLWVCMRVCECVCLWVWVWYECTSLELLAGVQIPNWNTLTMCGY